MPDTRQDQQKQSGTPPPSNPHRLHRWTDIFIILLLFFTLISFFERSGQERADIAYSEFKDRLRNDEIASVNIRGDRIEGTYRTSVNDHTTFITTFPPLEDSDLFPLLDQQDVEVRVSSDQQSVWTLLLINLLPWLLLIGIFMLGSR
ncbi:MAG: ATP-dependent metallopeptidase FtsH/Yme1/Tma family protein, partial [Planctomycetaceae bacterium]|nr:ATP-dependent metallopeptidase FtsH/Yme1/Tma family protein [Planctomycetaceae bacterium]